MAAKSSTKKAASTKRAATSAGTSTARAASEAAPPKKTAAKQTAPPKKATAKQTAPPKKATAKQTAPPKKATAKQTAPPKKTTAKQTAPPKKTTAKQTAPPKKTTAKQTAPPKKTTAKQTAPPKKTTAKQTAPKRITPQTSTPALETMHELPKPKFNKEGLGYTKDFDLAFIKAQYDLLQQERVHLTGQAKRLEDEAHQLVEEAEMGDVQFDDEGGEGDTMVVERERDLALSAQARDAVAEIDAAIVRIMEGTYGYSVVSGRPIPKERLEAIPWSSVLVEEKVGGIGRR